MAPGSAEAARVEPAQEVPESDEDPINRSRTCNGFARLRGLTCVGALAWRRGDFSFVIAPKAPRQDPAPRCAMKTTLLSKINRGKKITTRLSLAAVAPLLLAGCVVEPVPGHVVAASHGAAVSGEVVVERRPPALRVETRTVAPGPRYVWVRGHWRWTGVDYDWVPGRWVLRPRSSAMWVEGRWQRRPRGWAWYEGYWR